MTEQQHWPSLSASRPSIKASMDPSSGSTLIAFNDNPNVVNRRIRWRKGELIGAGAFGSVYMGMNLDSGELLAVKQVLIAAKNVGRERSQAHIRELEEELKLLQNLSHPNIVRYLGTAREDDALNIFLEFVPGGSIASLLRKFGSFPEPVIRTYSRQLLQGLEYLHKNGIMHRDIKGANILVDNKGCIKLADFGASKQVVELVTISGAKSMKGTPYWMAPEVIRQTGHSLPADIWSVGCTIIEMATGKAPWSQQFQEVTALFHIGTTKSHPPIPEHLSNKAQDFLRKCLRKEPYLRPTVSELLEHPFIKVGDVPRVLGPSQALRGIASSQALESSKKRPLFDDASEESCLKRSAVFCEDSVLGPFNSWRCSSTNKDSYAQRESFKSETNCSVRFDCGSFMTRSFKSACDNPFTGREWGQNGPLTEHSSFNPMNEPADAEDGWCNLASPEPQKKIELERMPTANSQEFSYMEDANFHFPCPPADDDDDDEVTESKIKAFLDEKALELKQLQTPLYMEYQSIWNMPSPYRNEDKNGTRSCDVQEQEGPNEDSALSLVTGTHLSASHSTRSSSKRSSRSGLSIRCSRASEATVSSDSPRVNELKRLLLETQQPLRSPSNLSSLDRQRLWKEELQQELDMRREERRKLAQVAGRTKCSPTPASKLAASSRPQTSSRKLLVL